MPNAIVTGPEGDLWFTEAPVLGSEDVSLGRITPQGVISQFSTGEPREADALQEGLEEAQLTVGPEGSLWFIQPKDTGVGRITPAGVITEFLRGRAPGAQPEALSFGPEGDLWFVETFAGRLGRLTGAGIFTELDPGFPPYSLPLGITAGPDHDLWIAESHADEIGQLDPASGRLLRQISTGESAYNEPHAIVEGAEGALWLTLPNNERIARLEPGAPTPPRPPVPMSLLAVRPIDSWEGGPGVSVRLRCHAGRRSCAGLVALTTFAREPEHRHEIVAFSRKPRSGFHEVVLGYEHYRVAPHRTARVLVGTMESDSRCPRACEECRLGSRWLRRAKRTTCLPRSREG